MILRCANGVRAAWIVRQASDSASVQVADLLLSAVVVRLALDRLAAELVVFGVAEEAGLAGTRGGVIVRPTLGVTAAEYQVARLLTLRLIKKIQ